MIDRLYTLKIKTGKFRVSHQRRCKRAELLEQRTINIQKNAQECAQKYGRRKF